ncbi:MAG: hypothetical protein ABIQ11_00725, partial [Saprospiraceae bacterium]
MVQFFLRLKHWQLFTILFAWPVVFYSYFIVQIFRNISVYDESDIGAIQHEMTFFFKMMPYLILPTLVVFYGGFWSVGVGLQEMIRPDLCLKTSTFKMTILLMAIHILVFI